MKSLKALLSLAISMSLVPYSAEAKSGKDVWYHVEVKCNLGGGLVKEHVLQINGGTEAAAAARGRTFAKKQSVTGGGYCFVSNIQTIVYN